VPAALWQALGEQGWLAVLVPEEHDGIGLGVLDAAVLAREFGAGTVPGPGSAPSWPARRSASRARRSSRPRACRPGCRRAQGRGRARQAGLVADAADAPATSSGGACPAARPGRVPAGRRRARRRRAGRASTWSTQGAGVTVTPQTALDRTVRLGTVELPAPPARSSRAARPELVQRLLDTAAVLVANDLVGIARRALTDTVEYDKTRVQFGKPVGSFQAIKHDLADLHIAITFAEHAATYAAYALDDQRRTRSSPPPSPRPRRPTPPTRRPPR
jgi:acyl-CoA dehydrogenase